MGIERTSFEGVSFTPLAQLQGNPVIGSQYQQTQPMLQVQQNASPAPFLPKPEGMA